MPEVDLLRRIAAEKIALPGQVAIGWLLARKPWIVPILGTRNVDHQREPRCLDVELTKADMDWIEAEFARLTVHGRSPDRSNYCHHAELQRGEAVDPACPGPPAQG